jgi:hypothetical protein
MTTYLIILHLMFSAGFGYAHFIYLKYYKKQKLDLGDCLLLIPSALFWPFWVSAVCGFMLLKRSEL